MKIHWPGLGRVLCKTEPLLGLRPAAEPCQTTMAGQWHGPADETFVEKVIGVGTVFYHRHRLQIALSSSPRIGIGSHRHRFASYRIASATSHFFFIVPHRHRLQNASIVYHRHRLASASFGIGSLASSGIGIVKFWVQPHSGTNQGADNN